MNSRDLFASIYIQKHFPMDDFMLENQSLKIERFQHVAKCAYDFADFMLEIGEKSKK